MHEVNFEKYILRALLDTISLTMTNFKTELKCVFMNQVYFEFKLTLRKVSRSLTKINFIYLQLTLN